MGLFFFLWQHIASLSGKLKAGKNLKENFRQHSDTEKTELESVNLMLLLLFLVCAVFSVLLILEYCPWQQMIFLLLAHWILM